MLCITFITAPLAIIVLVWSVVNWIQVLSSEQNIANASLLLLFSLCLVFAVTIIRRYATKTQDRIIRMEEQFRHYRLTGQELSPMLKISQIIALRNSSDDEFPELCERAAAENLNSAEIRSNIKHWRSDTMRI
ncbi:DUF6526 family protein [Evansella halocellulosilytica]|uniref:DUF6526 family protein n=1 Tax=Evansella halocellulosilytica TaxID=2011013 RepID=UPI00211D15AB|nr:DUF6526 family protein [Evansella halocellulosilytica]